MGPFHDLVVWQKSHALVLDLYKATLHFPQDERYALTSQLRRAATSIPANIAEGSGHDSDGDFSRFVAIALGSAAELEYHLLLARDLGYISSNDHRAFDQRLAEVKRMLVSLRRRLLKDRAHGSS